MADPFGPDGDLMWPDEAFEEPAVEHILPPTDEDLAAIEPPIPSNEEFAGVESATTSSAPAVQNPVGSSSSRASQATSASASSVSVKELPKESPAEKLEYDRRAFDKVKQRLFYKHLADNDKTIESGFRALT